jgi:hypothetical protein
MHAAAETRPRAMRRPGRIVERMLAYGLAIAGLIAAAAIASEPPRVVITNIEPRDGTIHVIGFLEGTDLKSAGIFDRGVKLKDINVGDTPGSQRVNFDFAIEAPSPSMSIEVTDAMGRSAAAQVTVTGAVAPPSEEIPETEGAAAPPAPAPGASGNTAEIQRYGGSGALSNDRGRRFPGGVSGRMSDVRIAIVRVMPLASRPGSYEVIGRIAGGRIHRAAIYVDGRPVKPIPISADPLKSFDVVFALTGGRDATIRAYGAGGNFVEMPIDLSGAGNVDNPYAGPRYGW